MIVIFFDGACNNTGTGENAMGVGVVAIRNKETILCEAAITPLIMGTSNIAEWIGLTRAVELACELSRQYPGEPIYFCGDSQLIVNQSLGKWRIKHESFMMYKELYEAGVRELGESYKGVMWVRRENNTNADRLSKIALNRHYS